ncbi:LysR substrate-binding domain-containing protein [uncultured Agrobacterium sp.]|uniref:LysR substrate-binding domain-containing protein n=1 Tax=uncultured Agrobacterium sp. TaxID=157277 RepID=UPI0025E05F17|nr:LysR substrate-binding domain-containing protein [uncultured Agrobacterium sp.]
MSFKMPSLIALRAFEAVARCGSVRGASEDLNVVHGAVSQQIKVLEDHLGVSLFERRGRRLVLTANGKRFAEAIQDAFGVIERATAEVTPTAAKRPFRLGIMQTFGAYWLIPRLEHLSQSRHSFELELVSVPVVKNLEDTNLDAVIVGGDYEPRPEIDGTRFMDDIVGPVMSPRLAQASEITSLSSSMTGAIAIVTASQPRLWNEWYKAAGAPSVRFSKRREFDSMSLSIEAARASLGIAVVPRPYVNEYLISGSLVAPFGFSKRSGGYHFLCRARDAELPVFQILRGFLLQQGASDLDS